MSDSTTTPRETEVPGRYLITQPSGPGLTVLVDTVTGRSWLRIAAGTDHYAWRPMQLELRSPTFLPGQVVEMMKRAAHWALE
jgi:hypothetical protein